jgi:hypothetical protein
MFIFNNNFGMFKNFSSSLLFIAIFTNTLIVRKKFANSLYFGSILVLVIYKKVGTKITLIWGLDITNF